jgi:hypothetical protein
MAPVDALDVEGRSAEALRYPYDLARRHEEEHRGRVDKAADAPGAPDSVDLGPFPRGETPLKPPPIARDDKGNLVALAFARYVRSASAIRRPGYDPAFFFARLTQTS